ncbi:MAG: cob(I)yrinic acid a,c-diamide adenosyltransferase [bacterium]|nr:cob(I)yrinic acid a,c-diamide adenosyltransferase [bacterium]
MKLKQGLIQIYTGNGKGKTTAAIGLANRAIASNLNVVIIQFLKGNYDQKTIHQNPKIQYKRFGLDHKKYGWLEKDVNGKTKNPYLDKFKECSKKGWQYTQRIIEEEKPDVLILDELNPALYFELLDIKEIVKTLKNKPPKMEIVVTGRQAPRELIKLADLVTEMKETKHPYQKGIQARKGIDY